MSHANRGGIIIRVLVLENGHLEKLNETPCITCSYVLLQHKRSGSYKGLNLGIFKFNTFIVLFPINVSYCHVFF